MKHRFERYCKDYKNIENYEAAKKDDFKGWVVHHRYETHNSDGERRLVDITPAELKALGMYYNRPASELIYLTKAEHTSLHTKGKPKSEEHKKKIGEANKNTSDETRRKKREANIGEKNPMYGKKHSAETKIKMSEVRKGKPKSIEHRKNIGKANEGKHWYHNDVENFYCYECPPGCKPGMLKRKKK